MCCHRSSSVLASCWHPSSLPSCGLWLHHTSFPFHHLCLFENPQRQTGDPCCSEGEACPKVLHQIALSNWSLGCFFGLWDSCPFLSSKRAFRTLDEPEVQEQGPSVHATGVQSIAKHPHDGAGKAVGRILWSYGITGVPPEHIPHNGMLFVAL